MKLQFAGIISIFGLPIPMDR